MQNTSNESDFDKSVDSGIVYNKKKNRNTVLILVLFFLVLTGVGVFIFAQYNGYSPETEVSEIEGSSNNEEEVLLETDKDTDEDGLPDIVEEAVETNAEEIDTDGDTYSDYEEIKGGYNPLNSEKYTAGEWNEIKNIIRDIDIDLYNELFNTETVKKVVNLSYLIGVCDNVEYEYYNTCVNTACDVAKSEEERIGECLLSNSRMDIDSCLMKISPLSMKVCNRLSDDDFKESCYFSVVAQEEDSLLCRQIGNADKKIQCYMNFALSKNDSEACQKIDYNYFQQWCDGDFTNSFEMCKEMKKGDFSWTEADLDKLKNSCLGAVTGDVSYCEKLVDKNSINHCYADVASRLDDLSVCDKIEDGYLFGKNDCYSRIAIERMDISLCNELNKEEEGVCDVNEIYLKNGDLSFCEELSELEQYRCYYNALLSVSDILEINKDEDSLNFCENIDQDEGCPICEKKL